MGGDGFSAIFLGDGTCGDGDSKTFNGTNGQKQPLHLLALALALALATLCQACVTLPPCSMV